MEDCARRYGDMFTLKITNEGTWVFVTDPDAVKQIFTGDPRLLHAGEANVVLLPVLGRQLGASARRGRSHGSAQADAAAIPWGAHARL